MPKEQDAFGAFMANQPPMIPHSVEGYQVTTSLVNGGCVDGTISITWRAAYRSLLTLWTATAKWARKWLPRRYFCLQCHVQADTTRQSWEYLYPIKVTGNGVVVGVRL